MPDPNAEATNTIQECLQFADGYAWGPVSMAKVSVGGESTSTAIPVQVIAGSTSSPSVPSPCSSASPSSTQIDSVDNLGANGVLGVGVFAQDCGGGCAQEVNNNMYWSCVTATNTCASTTQSETIQVANPVTAFPTDNNGVILQLPPVSSSGAATAAGFLVFGISTQTNNTLPASAHVLTVPNGGTNAGNFTTNFNGQTLTSSFIDSGSNALFFNDTALEGYECYSGNFYCPPSTTPLNATNQGSDGTTSSISFSIVDLSKLNTSNFALTDIGGPAPPIPNFGGYFDWGLPFFYGRTIFFAIEGANAGGTQGPYYAY